MAIAAMLVAAGATAFGAAPWGPPDQAGGEFKPGWNGEARTPPMGWRSWNAFGNRITEQTFHTAIDAITAKNWTVDGQKVSLQDIGYGSIGIDEGWEGCGMGVNGTQHYVNGTPAVNSKFSNMKALVDYGHSKNLRMGFYQNGCACGERVEKLINYQGDVAYLDAMGFDAVKLDGCGKQRNLTLYAQLMKATGKNYSIENCHWGDCTNSDDSSCPTVEWCPFNWYRSSGDINAGSMSWFNNLQTTVRFQDWTTPVSRQGCWAYPDMLEVGRVQGSLEWNRAHFGAWCIVSAPLVLGYDLTNAALTESIIDIIGNKEALAVNQAWAGHPGSLVWSRPTPPPPPGPPAPPGPLYVEGVPCDGSKAQAGFSYDAVAKAIKTPGGMCFDASDGAQIMAKPCDGSASQLWAHDESTGTFVQGENKCLDVWNFNGPRVDLYGCNKGTNQRFTVDASGVVKAASDRCLELTTTKPSDGPGPSGGKVMQLWAKPLEGGAVAALLINTCLTCNVTASVQLSDLNVSGTVKARDVWARADAGTHTGSVSLKVNGGDSAFLVLTPA